MFLIIVFMCMSSVIAGPATEAAAFKGQFCTDPRTMKKHAAYTEWADAYSCTRHRCQPGGRNLAIYTVGCKRVEAPESAIECEEVVEDTNIQFPFCCTRLRCLVVVRGEVWTRVLGQPWEALPAAPWSHMYKKKKPPPGDVLSELAIPTKNEGPVYELASTDTEETQKKVLRAKLSKDTPDYNEVAPPSNSGPDIVIALSTNDEKRERVKDLKKIDKLEKSKRHHGVRKTSATISPYLDEDVQSFGGLENEEFTEKIQPHQGWTEIPQNQWYEHETLADAESPVLKAEENSEHQELDKEEKPGNLQALVDAIGTRMRDIENVVQKMSEKVHQRPAEPELSDEKRVTEADSPTHKRHVDVSHGKDQPKKPNPDGDAYKRFSVRNRSKYLHGLDSTTEVPLFAEDSGMNGYFSDASNSVLRRANTPKEPALTYMAPVDSRRKAHLGDSDEFDSKHKKRHKKKRSKKGTHKKHRKEEKRRRFNRLNSVEIDKNVVSLEDSSAVRK